MEWEKYTPEEREAMRGLEFMRYEDAPQRNKMSEAAFDLISSICAAAAEDDFVWMHELAYNNAYEMASNANNATFRALLARAYEHAVASGDAESCCDLGNMYHETDNSGCVEDYATAASLYELGIQRGCAQCAVNLGYMYYYGRGTEVDYNKAFQCYALAAVTEDNPEALWKLGDLYADGKGVTRSDRMAWTLYSKAYQLSGGMPWGCRAAHHVADYLLRGVSGMLEADPLRALELYMKAELGYYEVIAKGQTYYRKCLDKAIRGQEKARRAIWETGA